MRRKGLKFEKLGLVGVKVNKFNLSSLSSVSISSKEHSDNNQHLNDNSHKEIDSFFLNHYLAGLIEGDGSVKVPKNLRSDKGNLVYPSVTITFADKELPLAQFLSKILDGRVNKTSGNWYVLSIYKISALYNLVCRINGKFRTPKLEALHQLIIWLNNYNKNKFYPAVTTKGLDLGSRGEIKLLPLDTSDITSNSWFSGFSDSDGGFQLNFEISSQRSAPTKEAIYAKNIHLRFRLSQRQEYHKKSETGTSYSSVIYSIAEVFKTKLTSFNRSRKFKKTSSAIPVEYIEKGFLVTVKSLNSRKALISYFSDFPLLSSKRLDYLSWLEAHNIVLKRSYRTIEGTNRLQELKSSMNSKRNIFDWKHLKFKE